MVTGQTVRNIVYRLNMPDHDPPGHCSGRSQGADCVLGKYAMKYCCSCALPGHCIQFRLPSSHNSGRAAVQHAVIPQLRPASHCNPNIFCPLKYLSPVRERGFQAGQSVVTPAVVTVVTGTEQLAKSWPTI